MLYHKSSNLLWKKPIIKYDLNFVSSKRKHRKWNWNRYIDSNLTTFYLIFIHSCIRSILCKYGCTISPSISKLIIHIKLFNIFLILISNKLQYINYLLIKSIPSYKVSTVTQHKAGPKISSLYAVICPLTSMIVGATKLP